ncbi:hypothetical protein IFM89_032061 [Coptis chinensis]|uniref:Uncharacterized protein n=1 Tax=Coptis chinensis TaxID=261450 RepID=A0A835M033_9MAGN|nr:hypothetical protein IFM89_032061 [Coptis chinensis]
MFLRVGDLIMEKEMKSNKSNSNMHHFVLVHGRSWSRSLQYKVKTLLESARHQVTALNLAASGINVTKLNEVDTMLEYSRPLIEFMLGNNLY